MPGKIILDWYNDGYLFSNNGELVCLMTQGIIKITLRNFYQRKINNYEMFILK